ncbi:triphosphoribosyl-dephospho-CoA synthase CitG [Photobacterium carnosum]|uniref:triphosphoribosyl-dephospho-CoA synthase CitG n=1 Tax=Photobacterium carnosum TaxID=2023717 RepID=UPI001E5CB85B|nr:triphosphoribosyl-dephospho-CoA synthase CitG [Photobacterium carnosum]MCD9496581.1 triphosphoribosyl-dephospho-CoA synthase CitG [Photobacterium carnosum]
MTNIAIDLLVDSKDYYNNKYIPLITLFKLIGNLGYHAMMLEVHLTPKPGLVDLTTNGAHDDMNVHTFEQSAQAISPFLIKFLYAGLNHSDSPIESLLPKLRPIGLSSEKAMLQATSGINTHKGMIFSLGIVCGVIGWLRGNNLSFDATHISEAIKCCCHDLIFNELFKKKYKTNTYGESIYKEYGLTGARGEAASGFATVMKYGLPAFEEIIKEGLSTEQALWQSLLALMANNLDTNLVSRGGMEGLLYVQQVAQMLLAKGGCHYVSLESELIELDKIFTKKRLSPGGSADLLAITWLLAQLNELSFKYNPINSRKP